MTLSAFNKPTHAMHLLKFKKPQEHALCYERQISQVALIFSTNTYTCNNNLVLVLVSILVSVSVYQHYLPKCKGKLTYAPALVVLLRQFELTRDKNNKQKLAKIKYNETETK